MYNKIKEPPKWKTLFDYAALLRLAKLVDIPSLKTCTYDSTVVAVVDHLLSVTCDDTLNRCKVSCVVEGRGQLHRHVRCVDVTRVKKAVALMTDNTRLSRRIRVYIDLVAALEGTYLLNTH